MGHFFPHSSAREDFPCTAWLYEGQCFGVILPMLTFCLGGSSLRNLRITSNQSHGLMTEKTDTLFGRGPWSIKYMSIQRYNASCTLTRTPKGLLYRVMSAITKSVLNYWKRKHEVHTGRTRGRSPTETNETSTEGCTFLYNPSSRQKNYERRPYPP